MDCHYLSSDEVTAAVIDLCIAICVICINSFIIFAVVRRWKNEGIPFGQEASTLFLMNLSAADACVGVCHVYLVLPHYVCSLAKYLAVTFTPCILRYSVIVSFHYASNITMLTIAMDRYLSIVHAVRYRDLMNRRRAVIIIAVIWSISPIAPFSLFYWNDWKHGVGCEVIQVMPRNYNYCVVLTLHLVVSTTMTFATWQIHRVVVRLRQRNTPLTMAQKMNTKTFRALVIFLSIYVINWTPYNIATYLSYEGYKIPVTVTHIVKTFSKINYIANPFLYAYHVRLVRNAMINAVRSVRRLVPIELSMTTSSPISDATPNKVFKISASAPTTPVPDSENCGEPDFTTNTSGTNPERNTAKPERRSNIL